AMSMMGGARLVRIEDAGDVLTPLLRDYLAQPSMANLLIIEAGELGPRSTLRALFEKLPNAAAVPCYVEDERDITRVIRDTVQQAGLRIDGDAVAYLAQTIGGDRARVRAELEKLCTYKGQENTPISLEDAQAACGQGATPSFDDLVYSVAGRQPEAALKALSLLQEEGVGFAPILRALQAHFRRLHLAGRRVDAGEDADHVMKTLTPPIFFKLQPGFSRQVRLWSSGAILNVLARLAALEAQCKQTGFPTDTLCAQAILGISHQK
ncbi:MAG: DNA polymerase III subunit delta, partial [Alphaproteobacteria bacterium]|nr:DNA polymerase III subunit delta [Alphaproteobacteria bacterium]